MYARYRSKQGAFSKGILVFSASLICILAIGLGLSGLLSGGGEEKATVQPPKLASPPADLATAPPRTETIETNDMKSMEEAVVLRKALPAPPAAEPAREVTYHEAETAYTERRYDDALDLFTLYTEQHPGNPWGHYMYGLSAWKAESLGDAETGFRTALRIDPRHMKSHLNLARVLLDDGRPGEALAEASAATELDSTCGEAYRLVGRAHHNLGQPEKAIAAYRRAVSLDTGDVWAMNNLGLLLIERECFEEALLPLAGAVAIEPEVVIFQNNLGIALERTGRHEAAADAFRAALEVDDTNEKVMANLTRVEARRNDPSVPPVDLGELASRFLSGIKGEGEMSEPLVSEAQPEQEPSVEN